MASHRPVSLKLGIGFRVVCLSATLVGCAAGRRELPDDEPSGPPVAADAPIIHGANDGGRHPSVVALVSLEGGLCTGALVAPKLVLTARHCVSELASPYIACPASGPQVGRTLTAESFFVYHGDEAAKGPAAARGARVHVPRGDVLCEADVAVLELDRPLVGIKPLELSAQSSFTTITAVGYGQISDRGRAGLRRYRAHVPVVSLLNMEFVVGESTCSGDSGSPALEEASGRIVGVLSRGGPTCDGKGNRNVYTRVGPWTDWLVSLGVPAPSTSSDPPPKGTGTTPTDVGEACSEGSTCSGGVCVTAEPKSYCSRRCGGTAPRCPNGYRCTPMAAGGSACARK